MKANYNSLWTSLYFSALLLSAGAAAADDFGRCSLANGAGRWGYTVTGTNTTGYPTPVIGTNTTRDPDAIVGSGTVDARGNVTLTKIEVTNGEFRPGSLKGNVIDLSPQDCSATLRLTVTEANGLVYTTTWAIVYVDNQREIRGILTKVDLPPGGLLPVQTLNAKMQFPGRLERF